MKNLKVKMMLCAMLMSCSFLMAGCGSLQQMTEVLGGQATEVQSEDDEEDERSETEESEEDDQERDEESDVDEVERDEEQDEEQDGEQDEEDSSVKPNVSGVPVFGQEDISDYEGFEYLYWEQLRTQNEKNEVTGKMESQELEIFLPLSDYSYVNRSQASSEKLGVEFEVELNPYLSLHSEDYLVYENLALYLEDAYDPYYYTDYKDVVISEVEEIDENSARATIEYCKYDKYDETYRTIFETYYLKMLENDVYVMVVVSVDHSETSGKTPMLIEELEEFYQFEIDFDKDRAQQKQETYLAGGGSNTHSTGYVLFELPEGWAEDDDNYEYDTYVYAPGGSISASGCGITFEKEYNDDIDKDIIKGNEEKLVEIIKEGFAEDGNLSEVEYYGETCLGETIKTTLTIEVDGMTANAEVYFIIGDYYIYRVTAMAKDGAAEDPFTVAADILENGQVR